ncbi:MAG: non-ribosomal peptide synthetase [Jatrophihabitans sp.]
MPAQDSSPQAPATGPLLTLDYDEVPCSLAQQRMWLLEQLGGADAAYNIAIGLRFIGPFDRSAAEQAVQKLLCRHEMLRTVFRHQDEELLQLIRPEVEPVRFAETRDLSSLADPAAGLDEVLKQAVNDRFDLNRELISFQLVRLAEDEHVLVIALDHIACDAWSAIVLARDLCELYRAAQSGQSPQLPDLPVQYADYGDWHRGWVASEAAVTQLDFWRQQLADPPGRLSLPALEPRGPQAPRAYRGRLDPDLSQRLRSSAAAASCPVAAMLYAGFVALLSRYSDQPELAIGSLVANRPQPELEDLIGFFTNTVVLRSNLSGDPSVTELLARCRASWLDGQLHQDVPFDEVVRAVQPPRYPDQQQPFFDVMFQVVEVGQEIVKAGDTTIELVEAQAPPAPVDLELTLFERDSGFEAEWDYDAGLLSLDTVQALHRHYVSILTSILDEPAATLSSLALLPANEQAALVGQPAQAPPPRLLHSYFEDAAASKPTALALSDRQQQLTYQQAEQRANRLAHLLIAEGVQPGQPVAVCLPRGIGLAIAFLAVLKAGAVYLPIDPSYPDQRIAGMLEQVPVELAITGQPSRDRVPGRLPVLIEAELADRLAALPSSPPAVATEADDRAYLIFTSGSSGLPKPVALAHRGGATIADHQRRLFGLGPSDVMLQHASPGFDASVFEMLMAFGAGARLHVAAEDADRADLGQVFAEGTITAATVPPSALSAVTPGQLGNVRVLTVAGEQCPRAVAERLAANCRFFNLYGPTEATIWSTWYEQTTAGPEAGAVPIGRPLPGTRAYVLDRAGNLMPPQAWGELVVGGPVLAEGYLDQPGLTATKFVPDRWGEPGARGYRTGDRARWNLDGQLEFGGRLDRQIKLRGHRIEPGEIESSLLRYPGIDQALVLLGRPDASGSSRLLAFVVSAEHPDGADLQAWCAAGLPSFMVPATIQVLTEFPLTRNGKPDHAALAALAMPSVTDAADQAAPEGELEEYLAGMWCELLGVEQLSRSADFFVLGGHSLLATLVVTRLRDELQLSVPLRVLFDTPTVAGLAQALRSLVADQPELGDGEDAAASTLV